jgi:hypothetical protein
MKPAVPPSDPEMHLAGNLARVPAGKSSGQSRSSGSRSNDGSRSDTVHVVAGGSLNEPSPDSNTIAQNDAQNGEVMVQSAPAVVKSKPPLDDTGRNTAAFPPVRKQSTTWTITQGVLQRSVDGGQTWQAAARAEHPLLCYANRGQEMWAGGEAGTLLRSSDNGATWNAVAVSYQGRSLDSAVTHIDVRGPAERGAAEVVVSTGDHQTWSTADGGKTWEKK